MIDLDKEREDAETALANGDPERLIFIKSVLDFNEETQNGNRYNPYQEGFVSGYIKCAESKQAELDDIFSIFSIGSAVRNINTLKANVSNSSRCSDCLSRIENIVTETVVSDEPEDFGEEHQESLLNWGESADEYEARFKALWSAKRAEIEQLKSQNHYLEEINSDLSQSLVLLKAKLQKVESGEFVLVPKLLNDKIVGHVVSKVLNDCCEDASVIHEIHAAVIEASEVSQETNKSKPCEYCDDGDGRCVFPYYGLAPHIHTKPIDGTVFNGEIPENFSPDGDGMGVYTHCLNCGCDGTEASEVSE